MPEQAFNRRVLIPATATAANICAGFLSLVAAADGRMELAVYLVLLAILLDMTDGRVARRLHATSRFGQELDSFSDALSFGAAPAFLVLRGVLHPLGPLGVSIALVYLLAAVLRLARFNLTTDAHAKSRRTVGLPTPIGASYLMALVLLREQLPAFVGAGVVMVMALLMVSRLPLPDLKGRGLVSAALLVGILSFLAFVLWPNWYTVGWWNLWNLVIVVVSRLEDRRADGEEDLEEDFEEGELPLLLDL